MIVNYKEDEGNVEEMDNKHMIEIELDDADWEDMEEEMEEDLDYD